MIRFALSALFALVLVAPASAQTVEMQIDFGALGYDANDSRLVEVDGNLSTTEWLLRERNGLRRYRLAFLREDGACLEDWFNPIPQNGGIYTVAVERAGLLHKLAVRPQTPFPTIPHPDPRTIVIGLDIVLCQ